MTQPAAHTPLESLFLFQSLVTHGVDTGAFARISELLINNSLIKDSDTYDPARLKPDALQQLFLLLLQDELSREAERGDATDGSPGSRKRKLGSPPLPTLKEVYEHVEKVPALINRLYARYRENIVKEIREDEQRFEKVQKEIQLLERTDRERRARAASQNGTPVLASRDTKPALTPNGPTPSPTPIPNVATPAAARRGPPHQTPVIPPKPPTTHVAPPTVAPPSHLPSGTPPVRPSPSPKPPHGNSSVLQPPAGVPQSGPRPLQPPPQVPSQSTPQPPKQGITPRPEVGIKPKDGTVAPQTATPVAALKWEKPYQPPHAAPTPPPRQYQAPAQHAKHPPAAPTTQHGQPTPQPSQPPRIQHPQPRPASGKPVLVPPQHAGQLPPPLQPAPPRQTGDASGAQTLQARPTSTTPVPHPTRPIQPPQGQAQQIPRHIASASPTLPTGTTGPIAPPQQRWPQGYQPQQGQHPSPSASPGPLAPKTDGKNYSSPYVTQPPRPAIPEHVIRQAVNTPVKRLGTPSAPHTPISATPTHLTHGFGTRWASQSTPSTPGPLSVEPQSPAYEPVSPPLKPATLPNSAGSTPRPLSKKQASKLVPKVESNVPKSVRGRSARGGQKGRGVSATPSLTRSRRSQSVMSHTDEPGNQTSELIPKIKDEDATPRPVEETGDTTADESVPGRPQIVTPSSVSSRLQKRKRQDTPSDPPPPTTQVLWTRGFTKVSSSALDQISSHRDANMFATALREKDAPNYHQIVLQPQDITSIRSAIKHGNKAAVQTAATLPGGDPGTAHVWLPVSDELVPPRGIINSAQLERELVHMFCNAIMYNPDPDRGPGPAFMKRSQDEEEEIVGYRLDENGVVKNTRSMFVEVEKLLGDLRSAEKERSAPPPSVNRPASVATPAEETGDDDEDVGDRETGTGTAKRRRIGTRG
ncbi:hypothetical protein ACJZ2D_005046 [Fusarium nematophilum]